MTTDISQSKKSAPQKEGEGDSMEDILHSIRDIIASEEAAAEADILELTDVVEEGAEDKDVLDDIDAALDVESEEQSNDEGFFTPIEEELSAAKKEPEQPIAPLIEETNFTTGSSSNTERLISDTSAEKSTAALKDLMNSIPQKKFDSPHFRTGDTVEDLVVETLKPMLKEWLDKNLPELVKELVEKEIRKLVPRE